MEAEKREILDYLKAAAGQYVSGKEINRRAGGKRRHRENPRWAVPILLRLVEEGLIEKDAAGHYRLKQAAGERTKGKRWMSPQMAAILRSSGKSFGEYKTVEIEMPDEEPFPTVTRARTPLRKSAASPPESTSPPTASGPEGR